MKIESKLKKYLPAYRGENYHEVSRSIHVLFKETLFLRWQIENKYK